MPKIVVMAGPNGAGKSTTAPMMLREALAVEEFVNADAIAAGLSGFAPERVAFTAGRAMLCRLHELAAERRDFAFETTLASRSFAPWLGKLRASGYRFELIYLWLPHAELAIERVAERVRRGGHDVPTDVIQRRYDKGLANFFDLYRCLADFWMMIDNSNPSDPNPIAWRLGRRPVITRHGGPWNVLKERYAAGKSI
jgi:Uncharacterized protein conserved in bacteria